MKWYSNNFLNQTLHVFTVKIVLFSPILKFNLLHKFKYTYKSMYMYSINVMQQQTHLTFTATSMFNMC
jgi:hypothetical protein